MIEGITVGVQGDAQHNDDTLVFVQDGDHLNQYIDKTYGIGITVEQDAGREIVVLHECPLEYKDRIPQLQEAFRSAYAERQKREKEMEESGLEDYDTVDFYTENQEQKNETKEYPYLTIKIDRDQYSIFEMKRKYDRHQISMDPEFQRNFVWKTSQMSELIESVIMGIPLPLIYLAENKDGKLVVVDGRQRLTTFIKFLNNEFRLNNLKILGVLNGMNFMDLEASKKYSQFATNIEDFQLVIQIIKYPTPDKVRFDIFDRVNRGGTPLNKQEMRNALYQGVSTVLLRELSETDEFREATGSSVSPLHMKDKYLILRAISFSLYQRGRLLTKGNTVVEYRSDIEDFLGKGMEYLNGFTATQFDRQKEEFCAIMRRCYEVLGSDGFRIPGATKRRKPISMTLFETFYYLFLLARDEKSDEKLRQCADELLNDDDFLYSLQFSVDSKNQVDKRFEKVRGKYMEVFDAEATLH